MTNKLSLPPTINTIITTINSIIDDLSTKQDKSNLVTSVSAQSTNTQYPSA